MIFFHIYCLLHSTAFYGLSLIAQTPDGAMTLRGFGWETYRVRSHSITSSITNTDTYQGLERRLSKIAALASPTISISPTINDNVVKREVNPSADTPKHFRFSQDKELMLPELKAKRSLTMPTDILLSSDEIPKMRHGKNRFSKNTILIDFLFF
jgi:hypothetical protein